MKKLTLLLVLTHLFFQTANAENEPNDNPIQANLLTLTGSQTGTLTGMDVDDWFVLNIPQAGTLTLSFIKTGGGQGNFYLKDGEKTDQPLINSFWITYTDSPNDGWKLSQPVLAGKYFIHLNKVNDAVNYTLSATLDAPVFTEDLEPNDTSTLAKSMPANGTVSGTLRYYHAGAGYDLEDWYKIVVPQGGTLNLTVQKKKGGQAYLYFRDNADAGKPVVKDWYWYYGESDASGWKWSFPVQAGTFYFQLKNDAGSPIDYQIQSELVLPAFAEDVEPNDTSATALPMPVNGTVSGTIRYFTAGKGFDWQDWYKIDVPRGGTLNFTVLKKKGGQAWFYLRDKSDASKPPMTDWHWYYGESDANGWKYAYPVQAGTFYLQIKNDAGDPIDYQIQTQLVLPEYAEDVEPNDTSTTASPMPVNGTVSGTIRYFTAEKGFDWQDWYKIVIPQGGILNLTVRKKKDGQAWFYLRDNADASKPFLKDWYWNYSEPGPDGWKWSYPVRAGTYFLQIKNDANTPIDYQIETNYIAAPQANFSAAKTASAIAFENTSTGEQNTYFWNFDDGTNSNAVNPLHDFKTPADYEVCLIATNPGGADTFCNIHIIKGLAEIRPLSGGNTGDATITAFGGGLDTNFIGKIMLGGTVIARSNFTGIPGKSAVELRFDLRDKPEGTYDFVVEKPGGPSYSMPGGFKIVAGMPPNLWANLGGRNRILFNTWTTYTINYGNNGNVDAKMVPIWLAVSRDPGLEVQFPGAQFVELDTSGQTPSEEGIFEDLDALFGQPGAWRVYPMLVPVVAASSSHSFKIKIKTSGNLKIHVWAEKPWFGSPINPNKLQCVGDVIASTPDSLGIKNKVDCAKTMISLMYDRIYDNYLFERRFHPDTKKPDVLGLLPKVLRLATKVCGVADKQDRAAIANWVTDQILNRWLDQFPDPKPAKPQGSGESCPAEFQPQNPTATSVTAVSSLDPNEKTGLDGFGPENFLQPTQTFSYSIFFENKASASAPAHTVVVLDTLDTSIFDMPSFTFGAMTVGDSTFAPPANTRQLVFDRPNFIPGKLTLRVLANVDLNSGIVRWTFRSFDPAALEDIEDPDLGFLPPNLASPEGQGSVSFSVNLKNEMTDGQQIRNHANIFFDANPPILTNEHFITCDAVAPASAVTMLPVSTHEEQFAVSWIGSDVGSGLQFYNVYFSENGGADSLWLTRTTANSAVFLGKMGSYYSFYSVAVDNAGNIEAAPASPDAQISVLVGTSDLADAVGISVFPNPAREWLNVVFENENRGVFQLFRPEGVVVFSQKIHGQKRLEIPVAGLPTGIYFWQFLGENGGSTTGNLMIDR